MRICIRRGLYGALAAGGILILGAGAASAADQTTANEATLLSDNSGAIAVEVPVNIGGNSVTLIGDSSSAGQGQAAVDTGTRTATAPSSGTTGGTIANDGTSSGVITANTTNVDASAPVNASGNSVSIIGDSTTTGTGTATAPSSGNTGYETDGSDPADSGRDGTDDGLLDEVTNRLNDGAITGNETSADVTAPVNVGGNSITLIGDSATTGTGTATAPSDGIDVTESGNNGSDDGQLDGTTDLPNGGLLNGNDTGADITVPVNVGGNSVTVVGDSATTGTGTAPAPNGDNGTDVTNDGADAMPNESGDGLNIGGLLTGNDTEVDANAPINVGGNAITVIGDSATSGTGTATAPSDGIDVTESGNNGSDDGQLDGTTDLPNGGLLNGNDTGADITVPVNVGGNAIAIIGDSATSGTGTATAPNGDDTTGNETDGTDTANPGKDGTDDGLLDEVNNRLNDGAVTGNETSVDATAPIDVGGNAITIIGNSATSGTGTATAPNGDDTTGNETDGDSMIDGTADLLDGGVLTGNNTAADVTAPVNVGGNAITVIGDSATTGTGTATAPNGDDTTGNETDGTDTANPGNDGTSNGTDDGLLDEVTNRLDNGAITGNETSVDATAPVNVGGNAITAIGDSATTGTGTSTAPNDNDSNGTDGTNDGAASDNDTGLDVDLPINIGGNAVTVIGDSSTSGMGASGPGRGSNDDTTPGGGTNPDDGTTPDNQGTPGQGGDKGTADNGTGDDSRSESDGSMPNDKGDSVGAGSTDAEGQGGPGGQDGMTTTRNVSNQGAESAVALGSGMAGAATFASSGQDFEVLSGSNTTAAAGNELSQPHAQGTSHDMLANTGTSSVMLAVWGGFLLLAGIMSLMIRRRVATA